MSMRKSRGLQRAAVGLGVAALNAASHANVFYVNFPDVVIGPDQDGEHFENLIGSVIFDFATPAITTQLGSGGTANFWAYDAIGKKGKASPSSRQSGGPLNLLSQNLVAFGTTIDASTGWTGGAFLSPGVIDGYMGVRVETGPGSVHYGWIRFNTGPQVTNPLPFFGNAGPAPAPAVNTSGLASSITLLDAAFETEPNTGIQAVPEASGTAAMAFLGLAGGLMAFRRHRARKQ